MEKKMKKTDIEIVIPTLLVAKPKGHKTNKFFYFNDKYKIDGVPVLEKNDFHTPENNRTISVKDEKVFVPISHDFEKKTSLNFRSYIILPTIGSSLPINYSNKSLMSPNKNMGDYCYRSYEDIPELKEIIYDERKDIEEKILLAKKEFVIVREDKITAKEDKNKFCLYVNFGIHDNEFYEDRGVFENNMKALFSGEIDFFNKNGHTPDYIAHEVLKQFVLYFIQILLTDNSFEFNDLNIAIKQKTNQLNLMQIIKKHYENDDICKTIGINISQSLYHHKTLKKEFIIDFVNFYKQNHNNLSEKKRDTIDYLVEKCFGSQNLVSGIGFNK